MQEIHHGLNRHQGREDPLSIIAREVAKETRLLCLDEFHVTDITDAMLMRRLLEGLLEQASIRCPERREFEDEILQRHSPTPPSAAADREGPDPISRASPSASQ